MHSFEAKIEIIGINPFVFVPEHILKKIFVESGKDKGHIPICGMINEKEYVQTLLKYQGDWRLYINTTMLANSPKRIGELIEVTIKLDTQDRTIKPNPKLVKAFDENKEAKNVFDKLTASKQKEIIRYISFLKSDISIEKNIEKLIGFLIGKNKFLGRDNP